MIEQAIGRTSIVAIGATVVTLSAIAVNPRPVNAASITFDVNAEISGNIFIDPTVEAFLNGQFGPLSLPNGQFDAIFSDSFTVDDDNLSQYLDGDISFGIDLLFSAYGISLDPGTLTFVNTFLDINFSGGGTFTNGIETLDFDFSYDEGNQEIVATFLNFDPNNNFIDSCLVGSCTAAGDFAFDLLANFLAQLSLGLPPSLVSSTGDFEVTATPVGGDDTGNPGGGDDTGNPGGGDDTGNPGGGDDTGNPGGGDDTGNPGGGDNDGNGSSQTIPEPATLLGLLGIGGFLASRRKRSRAK